MFQDLVFPGVTCAAPGRRSKLSGLDPLSNHGHMTPPPTLSALLVNFDGFHFLFLH